MPIFVIRHALRKTAYRGNHSHPCQRPLIWTAQTSAASGLSSSQTVSETDKGTLESQEDHEDLGPFEPSFPMALGLKLLTEKKTLVEHGQRVCSGHLKTTRFLFTACLGQMASFKNLLEFGDNKMLTKR